MYILAIDLHQLTLPIECYPFCIHTLDHMGKLKRFSREKLHVAQKLYDSQSTNILFTYSNFFSQWGYLTHFKTSGPLHLNKCPSNILSFIKLVTTQDLMPSYVPGLSPNLTKLKIFESLKDVHRLDCL